MQKILLTGVNGQVGHALKTILSEYEVVALSREQLDLSKTHDIKRIVREIKPNLIINPAAYTAVDKAESEPELAFAINATASQILAEEAARLNAALIHFSTDYVYDGTKNAQYVETDATNPMGVVYSGAGQVIVEHHRQLHDVEATRREIGGDEHLNE